RFSAKCFIEVNFPTLMVSGLEIKTNTTKFRFEMSSDLAPVISFTLKAAPWAHSPQISISPNLCPPPWERPLT
ncbi:8871_t:CDS:2, partial [Ambispora leptoticha]